MKNQLQEDAQQIARAAISAVCPDEAVRRVLSGKTYKGRLFLVSVGKAGWQMAKTALECLSQKPSDGVVITKYGHVKENLLGVTCFEAGHPVLDNNSISATQKVLDMTANLCESDTVLFLLSGGGSALFEKPLIPTEELQDITKQLLSCGADIVEMNVIRKRLSAVKGGRFASHCAPAKVESVILSDILGDPLDMIASGPTSPDSSSCDDAQKIVLKYNLKLSDKAKECLMQETPKSLDNISSKVIGSVRELCSAASKECEKKGYTPIFLTDRMNCEAREAGRFLASVLQSHANLGKKLAFLAGGETIVHLTGKGLGGRNQEIALGAAEGISGLNAALISVGSDGTDGPTDAAGGYVDGSTFTALKDKGFDVNSVLQNNDAYHALEAVGGLVITGPTGTNVNDVSIALLGN